MGQKKESDQTEQPTAKRLRDARKEGQVYRSQDLSKTLSLLYWVLLFSFLPGYFLEHLNTLFEAVFLGIQNPNQHTLSKVLIVASQELAWMLFPFILLGMLMAIIIEYLQVGPVMAFKKLLPNLQILNPTEGITRLFSQENLLEVFKSFVKASALTLIVILIVLSLLDQVLKLPYGPLNATFSIYWQAVSWSCAGVLFVFFFISVLDLIYQRHTYIKGLMMSRRDIKQEYKESEGDPMVKSKRKQLHQEWSQQNTLASVRKANVIVTNPTHIAVALYYDQDETELPVVVAKGEDYMAQQIREEAERCNIPIMRNIELARGLYRDIEVDNFITPEFFQAVAEILRWADSIHNEDRSES
ncbi:type III secretory pathway needle complex export protein [Oleiphilus messinensis]|uniref:Type III secretory pathway needle complex export protein n=1 Tax=Oleiphilus messinensis TaxID=141451 RepID=A0A1Y0IG12_9GAMM|nr:type III secretion system export apparatus subunit SctU [Oleiphilus messinensis]ARU59448.1 type III secretory pathway needle complex export protein [Oleiphilus messinensis]